jgi:RecJ-like exonuclease
MTNTKEVSKCCKDKLVEDYKNNPRDHHDPIAIYTCGKCKLECEVDEIEVCEHCDGTGEVSVDEQVYPGEPHTASIGTRKCICMLADEDDHQEQD